VSFDAFLQETGLTPRKQSGYRCTICKLPDELRNELEELRNRPVSVTFAVIAKYLAAKHGVDVQQGTVSKHFREHI